MLLVFRLKSLDAVFMIVISDENDYIELSINIQFSMHLLVYRQTNSYLSIKQVLEIIIFDQTNTSQ